MQPNAAPRLFGDIKPKSVRAVFPHPLSDHDRQRIANLIAEGETEGYGVARIDNNVRTVVLLTSNTKA